MKPKPPWQGPSCGFTLELPSGAEAAGEDCQRMGIQVAWPAGPGSRSCPRGGFQGKPASRFCWCIPVAEGSLGPKPSWMSYYGQGQRGDRGGGG